MNNNSSNSNRESGKFPWECVVLILGLVIFLKGCSAQYANGRYYPFSHSFEVTVGFLMFIFAFFALTDKRTKNALGIDLKKRTGPRNTVNWEAEAERINRLFVLSEKPGALCVSCKGDDSYADLLGRFCLRNSEPNSNHHWMAVVTVDMPEHFSLVHANDYVSIKHGNDTFMSQIDGDVYIHIVSSNGKVDVFLRSYLSITTGYNIDDIRRHINPILERKKYKCRVTPTGGITS